MKSNGDFFCLSKWFWYEKSSLCFWIYCPFFYFTSQNREERVWESLYISQLIPFEKLEQISVKRTGFLQSATVKVIARISENENLSEILYALRNGEFDDFEETEEHLFFFLPRRLIALITHYLLNFQKR